MKLFLFGGIFLILLALRFFFFYQNRPHLVDGQQISITTTLLSEPEIIGNFQRLYASIDGGERILILTSLFPQFHYGDTLAISGSLKYRVLRNGNIIITVYRPKVEAVKNKFNPILALTSSIRQKIISLFERTLPSTSSALLLGIVFGIKGSMPKQFLDDLRTSGVLHIIAASGMNVTITGGFLSSLFGFFFKRQVALVLSIFGILFYAVLSGLGASIIRASIMGILVFSAQILGRQRMASYGLLIAGYGMLFVSPNILKDVGFQLSFVATAGLLYIRPLFEKKDKIKKILNMSLVGEELVTTISAQIATLPILLANFGTYSIWSVVVNTLVLWTVPILMILGGIGAFFVVIEPIGKLFLYFSLPLLVYFEWVVNAFAELWGKFHIENIPWEFIVGYYLIVGSLILIFREKSQ